MSGSFSKRVWILVAAAAALVALFAVSTSSAGAKIVIAQKTYTMDQQDQKTRFTVGCPGKSIPFGGGMFATPTPSPDGEGVYPHSYERLGVQHGYHVTAALFDPAAPTTPRSVTLQVVCGPKLKHVTPPHTILQVDPGQTKTAIATCPGKRHLFGGGFQRTDFISRGGDYVTDSHAISPKAWAVTGTAFGGFGGELVSIAYCRRSKKPLVSEVSATAPVSMGQYATATTPPCPKGKRMVFGGFSGVPSGSTFLTDGHFNANNTWTAGGFNYFGPPSVLTAYGYCFNA